MKHLTKIFVSLIVIISMLLSAVSCVLPEGFPGMGEGSEGEAPEFCINGESRYVLEPGDVITLTLTVPEGVTGEVVWESSHSCVTVDGGVVTVLSVGTAVVKATLGDYSDRVIILIPGVIGGDSTGGDSTGGDSTGGDSTGGDSTGGDSTGGDSTGGDSTGGDSTGGDSTGGDSTGGDSTGGDSTGGDPDEDIYDFGAEYFTIPISEALEIAIDYTNVATKQKYYIAGTVEEITSTSKGRMYIYDTTGRIYVFKSSVSSSLGISLSSLEAGDVILIYGTLRNYSGTLEIEYGSIVAVKKHGNTGSGSSTGGTGSGGTGSGSTGTGGSTGGTGSGGTGSGSSTGGTGSGGTGTGSSTGGTGSGGTGTGGTGSDPYANVDVDEFYANYKPATSYEDAYFRTLHNLMSGTIGDQDQAPYISRYRPTSGGKFIRNTEMLYSEDGNVYYVVDAYGEIVMEIYRGAAYIMLEEVAAHVFAFGEPPANQSYSKNTSPTSSPWGEYLRVNHTDFSGSTTKYPYEPKLPNISGCGGTLYYYEMDIGTTGTDCDPSYPSVIYNNGSRIERGAARIVYVCEDDDGNGTVDHDERYVFYTYNHYNDFQEYLNYEGGWGQMFGNITGGGVISSKTNYNPTPYVAVTLAPITRQAEAAAILTFVDIRRYFVAAA